LAELKDSLSIIMPVKGREDFTRRWLMHHGRIDFPWRVLINDGDPESTLRSLIDDYIDSKAPDLSYEWCPESASTDYAQLLKRVLDLLCAVSTPYVMFAHHDDFILPSGVRYAVEFLDSHLDHTAYAGAFIGLHCVGGDNASSGPVVFGADWEGLRVIYPQVILEQGTAKDRVLGLAESYSPTWFAVHRTKELRSCFQAIVDMDLRDLLVVEQFQALFGATFGKIRQDHECALYVRQLNSSAVFSSLPDLFERLFNGTVVEDYRAMCQLISARIAEQDGSEAKQVERSVAITLFNRERNDILGGSLGNRASAATRRFLKAWVYTLGAKVDPVHRLLQACERHLVLSAIPRQAGPGGVPRAIVDGELTEVLASISSNPHAPSMVKSQGVAENNDLADP